MIILEELRNLAAELGLELFYFVGQSKVNTETVTTQNFRVKRHMGLLKKGEIYLNPINPQELRKKLRRAVKRTVKSRSIEKAQG
jgi:hypothetical protein